jgi:PKD repeat protein
VGNVVGGREGKLTCYSGGLNSNMLAAEFMADSTYGHQPFLVQFTDLSVGEINSWKWDFENDGTIDSEEQNPQHTYWETGLYSVSLVVSDGLFSETVLKSDYILVDLGMNIFDPESEPTLRADPNPFSSLTIISIQGAADSEITLKIYNLHGNLINQLKPNDQKNGLNHIKWNRRNSEGNIVNNGVYIGILLTGGMQKVIKFIVQ